VFLSTAAFTAMSHRTLLRLYVWRWITSPSQVRINIDTTRAVNATSPLGNRAFPVAAAQAWNALPSSVRTSSTYLAFRRQLKTLLFKASFEDRTWLRYLFVALPHWGPKSQHWHSTHSVCSVGMVTSMSSVKRINENECVALWWLVR